MKFFPDMKLKYCITFSLTILIINSFIYPQSNTQFIDKLNLDETHTRYYLHYDKNGNSPEGLGVDRLKGNIKAGDQIIVRFYPNSMFKIDTAKITLRPPTDNENCRFIFPSIKPDTLSIQMGYAEFYFATKEEGKFMLRIAKQQSKLKIGDTVKASSDTYKSLIKESVKESPKPENILTKQLHSYGFSNDWTIWKYENLFIDKEIYVVELFLYSPHSAVLLNRISALQVDDIYQNTRLTLKNDISASSESSMDKTARNGYFEGIISSPQTFPGVHSINIVYDFLKGSWYYRQAPTASKNRKLFYNDENVVIEKEKDLPSNVRMRAGFGVLNNLSEVRLISNIVLVMSPKSYFSESTPFFEGINPTLGLQVGATGEQEIVCLMGFSFKLINEGDFVIGFRFNGDNSKWQIGKNFYFGITLDPGLFGQLNKSK